MMFETDAVLTLATAKTGLEAGIARIEQGARAVDCAKLTQFDSSALAVLLAWRRAAQAHGAALSVRNLPAGLQSLARAYGIDSLLDAAPAL